MVAAWNDRPTIYVIGLAKHGKSTLVNALVGEAVAKPDLVIRTWRVDVYTASDAKSVEILWKDGRRTQHSVDEARALLDEEERKFEASEARVRSEHQRLLRLHGSSLSRADRLELRARLERLYLYRSPITHVRWPCRPGRVLNQFNVVDTPGLKQAGVAEPSTADEFYPQADGILWVVDGTTISSRESFEPLREFHERRQKLLPNHKTAVIVVVNRLDQVASTDDRRRVIEAARALFGDLALEVVGLSAKEAFEAVVSCDRHRMESSGFLELLAAIERHFGEDAALEERQLGLQEVFGETAQAIEHYLKVVQQDEQARSQQLKYLREDMAMHEKRFEEALEGALRSFRSATAKRLTSTTVMHLLSIKPAEERQAYIEQVLIPIDDLNLKLKEWHAEVRSTLADEAHRLVRQSRSPSPLDGLLMEDGLLPEVDLGTVGLQGAVAWQGAVGSANDELSWIIGVSLASGVLLGAVLGPLALLAGPIARLLGFGPTLAPPQREVVQRVRASLFGALDEVLNKARATALEVLNRQMHEFYESLKTALADRPFERHHGPRKLLGERESLLKQCLESLQAPIAKPHLGHLVVAHGTQGAHTVGRSVG